MPPDVVRLADPVRKKRGHGNSRNFTGVNSDVHRWRQRFLMRDSHFLRPQMTFLALPPSLMHVGGESAGL